MKNSFIFSLLLAVFAAGGGYWFGQHHAPANTSTTESPVASDASGKAGSTKLPLVRVKPAAAPEKTEKSSAKLSLADLEAKILELSKSGRMNFGFGLQKEQQEFFKQLMDVEVADIPELLRFTDKNLPPQMRWVVRYSLLARWAESDVSAAMAYANAMTSRQEREQAIGIVVGAWAGKDAKSAAEWAKQLPKGQLRDQVMNSVVGAMAATDPAAALELAKSLGLNSSRRFGMGFAWQIFQPWAARDPQAAAAKAGELNSAQQRSQAYQAIASAWAQTDPAAAATWANSLANGNDKRNALNNIISQWVQNDVQGALAYAKQLPEGPAKQQALNTVTQQWAQQDPKAAMDYANTLPAGKKRTDLLGNVINGWIQTDPEAAIKFAQDLPPGAERNKILQNSVNSLAWQDP
ncbi:MAG: hypothetical protein WCJ07_09720, partial [Verrucomicrobiota bacterium]